MKKIIAVCLALILCLPIAAHAEIDLGSMTFEELVELQNKLVDELVSRPEAKEKAVKISIHKSVLKDLFGKGASVVFTSGENYYFFWLGVKDFAGFITASEERIAEILQETANIEIQYDQDKVDQALEQIEKVREELANDK